MKVFIAVSLLVSLVSGREIFLWSSCGTSEYVSVNKMQVSPSPLVFPGRIIYDTEVEIKKALNNAKLEVTITTDHPTSPKTIPCKNKMGSCTYTNVCSFTKDMISENWGDIGADIGSQIWKRNPGLANTDFCNTGLQPQTIRGIGYLDIPKLASYFDTVTTDDYIVRLNFISNNDDSKVTCVEIRTRLEIPSGLGK